MYAWTSQSSAFSDSRIDFVHVFLEPVPLLRAQSDSFPAWTHVATVSIQVIFSNMHQHSTCNPIKRNTRLFLVPSIQYSPVDPQFMLLRQKIAKSISTALHGEASPLNVSLDSVRESRTPVDAFRSDLRNCCRLHIDFSVSRFLTITFELFHGDPTHPAKLENVLALRILLRSGSVCFLLLRRTLRRIPV